MELAKSWEPGDLLGDAKKITHSYFVRISEKMNWNSALETN